MNTQTLIELLSIKIGASYIGLRVMLFINFFFFFRGRRKARPPITKESNTPICDVTNE
jgi:hypothetical protein